MASAFRCPVCLTNWPPTSEYGSCPECEEPTSRMGTAEPLDAAVALSRKRHADFERFLEARNQS